MNGFGQKQFLLILTNFAMMVKYNSKKNVTTFNPNSKQNQIAKIQDI